MMLWAHNEHISMADDRMGEYLKRAFGDEVYLIGFEFNQGEFRSKSLVGAITGSLKTYLVGLYPLNTTVTISLG